MVSATLVTEALRHLDRPVTFWHGCSSDAVPSIMKEGIRPPYRIEPDEDPAAALRRHIMDLVHRFVGPDGARYLTDRDLEEMLEIGLGGRRDRLRGPAVYACPHPCAWRAAGYARNTAEHGGEITETVRRRLELALDREVLPLHHRAQPVLVRFDMPAGLVVTKAGEPFLSCLRRLERHGDLSARTGGDLLDALDFEVLIPAGVPPGAVSGFHPVPGKAALPRIPEGWLPAGIEVPELEADADEELDGVEP